jgi:hypothetical protein
MNRERFVLGLGSLFARTAYAQFKGLGAAAPAKAAPQ